MNQLQKNKEFVTRHFEELVNQKDMSTITRNFAPAFVDHEGPNGEPVGVDEGKARMQALMTRFPDLHVDLRDVIAEDNKVVVRGVWTVRKRQPARNCSSMALCCGGSRMDNSPSAGLLPRRLQKRKTILRSGEIKRSASVKGTERDRIRVTSQE